MTGIRDYAESMISSNKDESASYDVPVYNAYTAMMKLTVDNRLHRQ